MKCGNEMSPCNDEMSLFKAGMRILRNATDSVSDIQYSAVCTLAVRNVTKEVEHASRSHNAQVRRVLQAA